MEQGSFPPCMVNGNQSADERTAKYRLLRSYGLNSYQARQMRDWRDPYIDWFVKRWILLESNISPTFSQIRSTINKLEV